MNIECKQWVDVGRVGCGRCKADRYGGIPSNSTCLIFCPEYEGTQRPRELLNDAQRVSDPATSPEPCSGCEISRWPWKYFGVRVYEVFRPVRWWRWVHGDRTKYPGCGCIVKCKAIKTVVVHGVRHIWRA